MTVNLIDVFEWAARPFFIGGNFALSGDVTDHIAALIEGPLNAMGFDLVRVQMTGGGRPILQIMAEPTNGRIMTVDDCADISHALSAILDVDNALSAAYTLEISSPGIDRPLTRLKDYARFTGQEARVELRLPLDGRKRFRGFLQGIEGDNVRMLVDNEAIDIPFASISRAKLILTDELVSAAQKQADHPPHSNHSHTSKRT